MAKFFDNLRSLSQQPQFTQPETAVATEQELIDSFNEDAKADSEYQKEIDQQVRDTAPIRNEIRNISNGRVLVDRSIYDKTALERLLGSVKKMMEANNGALKPGYVVIRSNKNLPWGILGEARSQDFYYNRLFPGFKFQTSPYQNLGTKNSPYKIDLYAPNFTDLTDDIARDNLDSGWTIENYNDDDVESLTPSHELGHTAYFDVLNKTQNPALTFNQQEKSRREEFRKRNPSLQEIFDIAAKNTGYKTVSDAAATISDYAFEDAERDARRGGLDVSKNWSPSYHRLPELFAEAYNDFLYNGDSASDYSKELIRLYSTYVNNYNKTFEDNKIVLDQNYYPVNLGNDNFVNNLRLSR